MFNCDPADDYCGPDWPNPEMPENPGPSWIEVDRSTVFEHVLRRPDNPTVPDGRVAAELDWLRRCCEPVKVLGGGRFLIYAN